VLGQTTKDVPFKSIIRSGGMNLAFSNPNHHKALIEKTGGDLILFNNRQFHAASAFVENLDELLQMARYILNFINCHIYLFAYNFV